MAFQPKEGEHTERPDPKFVLIWHAYIPPLQRSRFHPEQTKLDQTRLDRCSGNECHSSTCRICGGFCEQGRVFRVRGRPGQRSIVERQNARTHARTSTHATRHVLPRGFIKREYCCIVSYLPPRRSATRTTVCTQPPPSIPAGR